jgi:hypothetical protein
MHSGLPVLFLTHGRSFGSHIKREAPFVNRITDLTGTGTKPEAPKEPRASTAGLHRGKRLLKGSLILADLLLLGLVIYLVFRSHGTFGFVEISLCVIAVMMGSWLTCLALWLE